MNTLTNKTTPNYSLIPRDAWHTTPTTTTTLTTTTTPTTTTPTNTITTTTPTNTTDTTFQSRQKNKESGTKY